MPGSTRSSINASARSSSKADGALYRFLRHHFDATAISRSARGSTFSRRIVAAAKTPYDLVSINVLAAFDGVGAVVEFVDLFLRQLDDFVLLGRLLFHDVPNGTSATGAFAFAKSRVNQRFVIFSTTVFCRRRARRLVKSTLSSGWS